MGKFPTFTKFDVGSRFRQAREKINKTQKELAEMLDMKGSSISSIEVGKAFPSVQILQYMYENFGISPLWIITGDGEILVKLHQETEIPENILIEMLFPGVEIDETFISLIHILKNPKWIDILKHEFLIAFKYAERKFPDLFEKGDNSVKIGGASAR